MSQCSVFQYYRIARDSVLGSEHASEVQWQRSLVGCPITEQTFLREYSWVVLNSGFKESVVRRLFDYISLCFCDWESSSEIVTHGKICILTAMEVFANERKLRAIVSTAGIIASGGFASFARWLEEKPLPRLEELPFIGSVTARHLAKNLGYQIVKPDRHLRRLASTFGFCSAEMMCLYISRQFGDSIADVDLILWRFQASVLNHYIDSSAELLIDDRQQLPVLKCGNGGPSPLILPVVADEPLLRGVS